MKGSKVVFIGGFAGVGKTFIGKMLSCNLNASYIDKDSYSDMTEALLTSLGCNADDRESDDYLAIVRPVEYASLLEIVRDNVAAGRDVVCVAPFVAEFNSEQWADGIYEDSLANNYTPYFVWLNADSDIVYQRLNERGYSRDLWKLDNWGKYTSQLPVVDGSSGISPFRIVDTNPHEGFSMGDRVDEIVSWISANGQ